MIIPRRLETLPRHIPWSNWALIALNCIAFLATATGTIPDETLGKLVLTRNWDFGLLSHMFLHADIWHIAGNMLFLWVFGNALCSTLGNLAYLTLYLGFGLLAAGGHLLLSDHPAVGASGAICGVVGCILALFPQNKIHFTWLFSVAIARDFRWDAWVMVLGWILLDAYGALRGDPGVAYGAHLGGYAAGLAIGYLGLSIGRIRLTVYDNRSLPEIFSGKTLERVELE